MSRGRPRLSVRLEPSLLDRVMARARAEGVPVSDMLRRSLATYTEDVGPESVMIRLSPYYREQLLRRLRDYPDQKPSALLERFLQLAIDGAWI